MDSDHDSVQLPQIRPNVESQMIAVCLSQSFASKNNGRTKSGSSTSTTSSPASTSKKVPPTMTRNVRGWQNHNHNPLKPALEEETNKNAKTSASVWDNDAPIPNPFDRKSYTEVVSNLKRYQDKGRYTDFITRERIRHPMIKRVAFTDFYKLDMESLKQEMEETLDPELHDIEASPFAYEVDEELQRKDFEEFIVLQSISPSEMGHSYFKIIKLFRYVSITNVQGTMIALLSLNRLIKRSPEVVQAVEESDGIALLLNMLECKTMCVQLASMQLLSSLFKVTYLRRMAVAYGAVQVLVNLLLESDDNIKVMTSDLLASLALLKEARQIIPQTKGIQHLVGLLNMTAHRTENPMRSENVPYLRSADRSKRRHSLVNEEELRAREDMLRGERVLISVATALWRFSRSAINRHIMQRAGLVLTLVRLVKIKNEKVLVPVLGILQGCATDAAFRLSIRTEGILKFLSEHLRCTDPKVKLQCARTLYYCANDDVTKVMISTLGGLNALSTNLKIQINEATKLLRLGWIEANNAGGIEYNLAERRLTREENNGSSVSMKPQTNSPQPEVRVSRLRMSGQSVSHTRTGSAASRSNSDKDDDSITFQLLHTILAVIGKCCSLESNLITLHQLGVSECLIKLLHLVPPYLMSFRQPSCAVSTKLQKVTLLERVCALNIHCLSLIARLPVVQTQLATSSSSLKNLINLLSHVSPDILVPTINALASLGADQNLMQILTKQKGFRYLFSLSFHPDPRVRTSALWAVRAFLNTAQSRSKLLRPVSSSLGYLVQTLSTEYTELSAFSPKPDLEKEQLLSALCSVLAEIASEDQGRAILIELGVVPCLANLTTIAQEDCLRIGVTKAITQFGNSDVMVRAFRNRAVLNALIEFVRLGSLELKISAARALDVLSADSVICSSVRALDVTSTLLQIMCDAPPELQAAAAHVIGRIARLSLSTSPRSVRH